MQVITPETTPDQFPPDLQGESGHQLGRSAPGVFKVESFDYQLMKFLSLSSVSGAEAGEVLSLARKIKDGDRDSWAEEWSATAKRIYDLAESFLDRGDKISAREAYLRAACYYQASFFFLPETNPLKNELYALHVGSFRAAGALCTPAFEPLDIPYGDKALPGYFLKCDATDEPKPTVLIQTGGDGTCEQMYFSGGGQAALKRGYNVILYEGPGQSGAYARDPELVFRHDWEVPVGAVLDYAEARREVDNDRIALVGYSQGGYFTPRVAAHDKRVAAVVAVCIIVDTLDAIVKTMELKDLIKPGGVENFTGEMTPRQRLLVEELLPRYGLYNGLDDFRAWADEVGKMNLNGLEDRITCPVLNIQTTGEGAPLFHAAREFFDKLPNPKNEFVLFTQDDGAEMHCSGNNRSLLHHVMFAWLNDVFDHNP